MATYGRGASVWAAVLTLLTSVSSIGIAQMHYVKKPGTVVRAVGVYEWTGDLAKPNASRLIPISIFIDGKLEDAGVYLARPVPMALETGTVFELDRAGVPTGLLDLSFARHLQPSDASNAAPYDDGWFGYGTFKAPAAPKPVLSKVRQSRSSVQSSKPDTAGPSLSNKTDSTTTASDDSSRPTLTRRDGPSPTTNTTASPAPAASTTNTSTATPPDDPNRPTLQRRDGSTPALDTSTPTPITPSATTTSTAAKSDPKPDDDPDRPTLQRRDGATSSAASSAGSTPATDPDRPTMKRHTDDSNSTSDSSSTTKDDDPDRPVLTRRNGSDTSPDATASTGTTPADDPDRPTLRKRTPAEQKQAQKENSGASVSGVGSLNDDPNRPTLHRGKPSHALTDDDLPKLMGLPVDLEQMAAVSDAVNRPEHDFARPWAGSSEHEDIQAKMEDLGRTKLLAYLAPLTPVAPAKKLVPNTPAARAAARKAKAAAPPAPLPLTDKVLKSYTLSYGGAATFCFSATSAAQDGTVRYIMLVTQRDANDALKIAFSSVTDSQHLDRTPRYRLVDVVDAEASNRASLLFELRAQQSRSFALYRVIGAQAEQIFSTGSTQ